MNLWDSDDDDNKNENNEENNLVDNNTRFENPKNAALEKRKDYRLFKQVKDLVKNLNENINNRVFDKILDVYEKLIRMKPDMLNLFKDKELPKLYPKSLYLVKKVFKDNESTDRSQRGKGTHFNKLKKLVEEVDEDINNIINDYLEDKTSDDELDLDENFGVEINIDEEDNRGNVEYERKKYISDDPAIRRLNWVKLEFFPDYIQWKKSKIQAEQLTLQSQNSIKTISALDSSIRTDFSSVTNKKDTKAEKAEKNLKRQNERDDNGLKSEEEVQKEYENILGLIDQSNKTYEVIDRLENCLSFDQKKDRTLRLKMLLTLVNCYVSNFNSENNEKNINKLEEIINRVKECNLISEEIMINQMSIRKNSLLDDSNGLGDSQATGGFSHKRKPRKISTSTKFEDEDEENHREAFEMKIIKENAALTRFQTSIAIILDKLKNEIYKNYQIYGSNTNIFLKIAKNEVKFINLSFEVNNNRLICLISNRLIKSKISFLTLSCLYYRKNDIIRKIVKNYFTENSNDNLGLSITSNYDEKINNLFRDAYNGDDNRTKINVNLMEIYHLTINNSYIKAKEMFDKVNFTTLLTHSDRFDKLLYNRVLVQLGLSAFRLEKFSDTKHYLNSLCKEGKGRLKDNLCQNTEYYDNLELEDLKKLNPVHSNLNLDEIEVFYYLTLVIEDLDTVLLERLGKLESNTHLKYQLGSYEKQVSYKNKIDFQ